MRHDQKPKLLKRVIDKCVSAFSSTVLLTLIILFVVIVEPITKRVNKMKIFKGMDDNQFWMTLWAFVALVVMSLLALIAYSSAATDQQINAMIEKGYDPIELTCLFNAGSTSVAAPCLLISQAKAKAILEEANVSE